MFQLKFIRKARLSEESALKLIRENRKISAAMIQRRFGVGYADAALMLRRLEKKGYIRHDGQRWVKAK